LRRVAAGPGVGVILGRASLPRRRLAKLAPTPVHGRTFSCRILVPHTPLPAGSPALRLAAGLGVLWPFTRGSPL
jgi:hypothetical protein